MNFQANIRMSFAFLITMTSLHSAWSGSRFLRAATNQKTPFGRGSHPLVRKARHAMRYSMPCVRLHRIQEIKDRFERWMDKDQNGRANYTEVRNYLQTIKRDVADDVINFFIERRDQNGNGEIDLIPEYLEEILVGDYGMDAAREWFYLQDTNDDHYVSKQELVHLAQIMGMSKEAAEENVVGYYLPLDIDGDGKLSFEEFKQIYEPPPQMPTV